jgi:transcriptional regulator with XRE-family HTH domain
MLLTQENTMATIDWKDAVARAVRRHRADLGISQEELAEKANSGRGYISRIESGSVDVSLAVFVRLAIALEMEPWELLRDAQIAVPRRSVSKTGKK